MDVSLATAGNLEFLIFDSTSGAILFQSAAKAFGTGSGYKFSDPFSFTFSPGTTYGLTAVADVSAGYVIDTTPNTVGVFSFLASNQNTTGTFAAPTLDTSTFCCDVGTAIETADSATPEPQSLFLLAGGLLFLRCRKKRPQQEIHRAAC